MATTMVETSPGCFERVDPEATTKVEDELLDESGRLVAMIISSEGRRPIRFWPRMETELELA